MIRNQESRVYRFFQLPLSRRWSEYSLGQCMEEGMRSQASNMVSQAVQHRFPLSEKVLSFMADAGGKIGA